MKFSPNHDLEKWRNLWIDAVEHSTVRTRRIRPPEEQIEKWDKMAAWFAQRTGQPGNEKNREEILLWLESEGALRPGMKVLDIGAGPGNWSLSLAREGARVTALEPSPKMVEILKDRIRSQKVENIAVDQRRWQDVNVKKEGLTSKFDLVFASMTPGVQGPEELDKMMQASKNYCYLSRFSGPRDCLGFEGVWRMFFKDEEQSNPGDIIYPFTTLYAMGYRPKLEFFTREHDNSLDAETAVERILATLWNYMDETPAVRKKVETYVQERTTNGILHEKRRICQGVMMWQVK